MVRKASIARTQCDEERSSGRATIATSIPVTPAKAGFQMTMAATAADMDPGLRTCKEIACGLKKPSCWKVTHTRWFWIS